LEIIDWLILNKQFFLNKLPKLIILDISGNEISRERQYIIYHLKKKLKVLDGISIEQLEIQQSNEMFAGRLTDEILESRCSTNYFTDVRELDISS